DALSPLGRLVRNELLESLRDRRTIITLVAMPLLLYPLLSFAFKQFFLASQVGVPAEKTAGGELRIGVASARDGDELNRVLRIGNARVLARVRKSENAVQDRKVRQLDPWLCIASAHPGLKKFLNTGDGQLSTDDILQEALKQGIVQLIVRFSPREPRFGKSQKVDCELISLEGSPHSQATLTYVERRIAAYNEDK